MRGDWMSQAREYEAVDRAVLEQIGEAWFAANNKPRKPRDRSREPLTKQALAILARLLEGPATSLELQRAARCLSHTARLTELRKRGYVIECSRERREDGVTVATFTLISEPGK